MSFEHLLIRLFILTCDQCVW